MIDAGGLLINDGNIDLANQVFFTASQIFGTIRNSSVIDVIDASLLVFNDGSTYQHNYTSGGDIPLVTWSANSSVEIINLSDSNPLAPNNLNQQFGNFIWNTPGMGATTTFSLNGQLSNIQGDLVFQASNRPIHFSYMAPGYTLNVGGTLSIQGGIIFLTRGTTTPTTITVGNFSQSGGNLSFGTSTDQVVEFNVSGNFTKTAGTLTIGTGIGERHLNFVGNLSNTDQQVSANAFASSNSLVVTVAANTTVDFGSAALFNSVLTTGSIVVEGTVKLGSTNATGAITGNIALTNRTFQSGSTIIYNGASAQFMGSDHPTTDGVNTTIDNVAGVTLTGNVTIGGRLHLDNGNLNVGNHTLTLNDEFLADSPYALNVTPSSSIAIGVGDAGPFGTLVTTGSTEINNFSLDRSGQSINIGNSLTINGTLTHNATINFSGPYTFDIRGPYVTTGGSLIGNASSTLSISGSGSLTGDVSLAGTLGTLTINRPVGVTNTTSITIANALNILSGTYQGTGLVTLSPGATLTRQDGTITKNLSVSTYNLVYTNTGVLTTGSELVTTPSTALNNLVISGGNSVTLNASLTDITVNGTLSLLSGEFVSNGKEIFIEGDIVSSGTGTFANSEVTFSGNTVLSGTVNLQLDDVRIESGAILDLGSQVDLSIAGNFTIESGATMIRGTRTTFFNGSTTILLPDVATVARFNNLTVSSSSTLIVDCVDCGAENNRPYIEVYGNWNSNNSSAVFNAAPGDSRTGVRLAGGNANISMLSNQEFWDLWVAGTGTATLQTALNIANDLELEGIKSLNTSVSNYDVKIGGDFLFDGGSFIPNQSTVTFNGTGNQTIDRLSGSGVATFFNITVNKAGGNFANRTNTELQNVFTVSSNTSIDFDGPGTDTFTLLSTASRTASIGPILPPANPLLVNGSVIFQRFMHAEGLIARYISSPVAATAAQLQDDFPLTGSFTGSNTCGSFQAGRPNMFTYNEIQPGNADTGYEQFPVSNVTESLLAGRGYSVYMCDPAAQITWDLTGAINKGNISLPVTFTSTGDASADGFNLVGNPYPSAIDWADPDWVKTNIGSSIYIMDNGLPNTPSGSSGGSVFATYNAALNLGTNGGERNIAPGQAFWVQATGSNPVLIATEGVKVNAQPIFFREAQPKDYVRIALVQGLYRDETIIHFRNDATTKFDPLLDSRKLPNKIFNISTFNEDSTQMAVNCVNPSACSREFGVDINNVLPGQYTMEFTEFETFQTALKIYLIDNFTNTTTEIGEKKYYNFEITDNPMSAGSNRFVVLLHPGETINASLPANGQVTCNEGATVEIESAQDGISYFAMLNGTAISEELKGNGRKLTLDIEAAKLSKGINNIIIYARKGDCEYVPLSHNVSLVYDSLYEPQAGETVSICQEGKAVFQVSGAGEGGRYFWYETEAQLQPIAITETGIFETPTLSKSATFYVSIGNTLGCEGPRVPLRAAVSMFENAVITNEGHRLVSNYENGNRWYLNSEPIDSETSQELIPSESGLYTLTVTTPEGCTTSAELEYILTNTELLGASYVTISPNPADTKVEISVKTTNNITGELITTSGISINQLIFAKENNILTAFTDVSELAAGLYIVKITDGKVVTYKKLIKK